MNDWVDYFEHFPEENPANYVGNEFNPALAQEIRDRAKTTEAQVKRETAKQLKYDEDARLAIQQLIAKAKILKQ